MNENIQSVLAESAPAPIGPYSQAVKAGGFLFVSGQIGLVPENGTLVQGGAAAEADQVLRNLSAIVRAAGATMEDVVRVSIYLQEIDDFSEVNGVYGKYFSALRPARSTLGGLQLPKGALVEMDAIVRLPE